MSDDGAVGTVTTSLVFKNEFLFVCNELCIIPQSVEVKWKLQEENNNNSNKPSIASSTKSETASDPTSKGSKPAAKEDNLHTHTSTVLPSDTGADQEPVSVQGRVVSAQEQQAEAMRLASGFVAAILASALADYIAQEAEGDQDGRRLVSAAQVITF